MFSILIIFVEREREIERKTFSLCYQSSYKLTNAINCFSLQSRPAKFAA